MDQGAVTLLLVKLVLGAFAAFFAIMLWSKTRDTAWMCLVAGTVISYAGTMFDLIRFFGLSAGTGVRVFGMLLSDLFFAAVPPCFFIAAFILMLVRVTKR